MHHINHLYKNIENLKKFILQNYNNAYGGSTLVQIFSSNASQESVVKIKKEVLSFISDAAIIDTTTAGVVHDATIEDNAIVLSFSFFESSSVKDGAYCNEDIDFIISDLEQNYINDETKLLIAFANTFKFDSSSFLKKLTTKHPNIAIVGGNAGDDFQFQKCFVGSSKHENSDLSFAIINSKQLQVTTNYLFNLETIGKEMVVTKAKGNRVYEINNKPILSEFEKYLGLHVRNNLLEYGIEFPLVFKDVDTIVARALVAFDENEGSITFAGNIPEGVSVRFGFSDIESIEHKNIEQLALRHKTKSDAVYIYTCGSRRQMLGTFLNQEIKGLGNLGNTAGFITYGEFFHNTANCNNNLLNITTTYVTISENENTLELVPVRDESILTRDEVRLAALTTLIKQTSQDLDENIFYLEQFRNVVSEASILSVTDKSGKITHLNQNFEKISGYTEAELIGKNHSVVRHPDMEDKVFKDMWNTIKDGNIWKGLIKNRAKDGSDYSVVSEIAPIYNKDGSFKEYIGVRNDVTELEAIKNILKQELDASKEDFLENVSYFKQYEEAINLSIALIRTDVNNNIKYVNEKFVDLSGYTKDELIGKNSKIIRHKKHLDDNLCQNMLHDTKNNKVGKYVTVNIAKDNSEFVTNTIIYPIKDTKNNIIEVLHVMYDITDIVKLNDEIVHTQKEVVEKMGAIGETRSKETGEHVKRVAEYSYLLALLYGLDEHEANLLKQASPMHDIGKVGIADSILNKPGKLTLDEYEIMKTHATLGYEMLKHSDRPILKASAVVAYTHHEKWNGSGYPNGLSGEDIHIFGRITAVADVFDALGHDRVYKKAWEIERILQLFNDEKGKHFEPKLIELFLENLDKFLDIKNKFDGKVL